MSSAAVVIGALRVNVNQYTFSKSNTDIFINDSHVNVGHLFNLVVGCFGLNGPLRQYFSLYRAVSQRQGERKEK